MPFFRKKPVVIEAHQLTMESAPGILGWCNGNAFIARTWASGHRWGLTIATLEGDHVAQPGDWIIRGVKGEFYPRRPEIFDATYEPARGDADDAKGTP